ncbi:hypothetical protein Tco_0863010, partial [Tanacetum coccineum]
MVQKQIEEDKVRQLAIMNLVVEYNHACTAKDELRNAYEKCTDISQEKRVLIDMRSSAEKETRVHSLPLDQPFNSYGLHTLLMSSESDTRITTALEDAKEEVMRSINEKQELINNYR